jgi:hypothetical protein
MYEKSANRNGLFANAEVLDRDAEDRQEIALRLTHEAIRQGQRAVIGLFAAPASLAYGVAASVSFLTAFLERGFEIFELTVERVSRDVQTVGREPERLVPRAEETAEKTKQPRS